MRARQAIVITLHQRCDSNLPLRQLSITRICRYFELGQQRLEAQFVMWVNHSDAASTPTVLLLRLVRLPRVLHESLILRLLLVHCYHELLL